MAYLSAYGHSWIDGDGASDPVHCLVERAAFHLELEARNCGVGGSLSSGTAELVAAHPLERAELYLLMTGLNDARLYGSGWTGRQAYAEALESIVHAFAAASPAAAVLAVRQPYLTDYSGHAPHNKGSDETIAAYNDILAEVSAGHPAVHLVTVADWDRQTMLAADGVHPNDAGHACIAAAVVRTARSAAAAR